MELKINLSDNKSISDLYVKNFLNSLENKNQYFSLFLNGTNIFKIPDFSLFHNLQTIDLSNNPQLKINYFTLYKNFENLREFRNLIIDINNENDINKIIFSMPFLQSLNKKNINDVNINLSLNDEIPIIKKNFQFISEIIDKNLINKLNEDVKKIFNNGINDINIQNNNFDYFKSTFNVKYKIYSYFYDFLFELLKPNVNTNENQKKNIFNFMEEIKNIIDFYYDIIYKMEKNKNYYNKKLFKSFKKEKLKNFDSHLNKSNKLNKQNIPLHLYIKIPLKNKNIQNYSNYSFEFLKTVNDILNFNSKNNKSFNNKDFYEKIEFNKEEEKENNNISKTLNNFSNKNLLKKSTIISIKNFSSEKILNINKIINYFDIIYKEKKISNIKNKNNNFPLNTMEQFIKKYYLKKYGIQNIIDHKIEKINQILIKFSDSEPEIKLFGLIFHNEFNENCYYLKNIIKKYLNNITKNNNIDKHLINYISNDLFYNNKNLKNIFINKIKEIKFLTYNDLFKTLLLIRINEKENYFKNFNFVYRKYDNLNKGFLTNDLCIKFFEEIYEILKNEKNFYFKNESKNDFTLIMLSNVETNDKNILTYHQLSELFCDNKIMESLSTVKI